MRTGRKRHPTWRKFNRYNRQYYTRKEESAPHKASVIAKCIKCGHVSTTHLDLLANHALYGSEEWSSTVRAEAQAIMDGKLQRKVKKRRLVELNMENANADHVEVC